MVLGSVLKPAEELTQYRHFDGIVTSFVRIYLDRSHTDPSV